MFSYCLPVSTINHFFNCIKTDCEPSVSAEDGLRTIEIIEKTYKIAQKANNNGQPS